MTIKEYVKARKEEIKAEVAAMAKKPNLVIVQLNEDEASKAYVKGKLKDATELGINAKLIKLPVDTSEKELLKVIAKLMEQGKKEEALKTWEKTIHSTKTTDPMHYVALISYAGYQVETGNPDEMLKMLKPALDNPQFQGLATEVAVLFLVRQNQKQKAKELIQQAENFQKIGLFDDCEIVMKNIEKLNAEKEQLLTLKEHPLMAKEKQMKVCEVCGALQSAVDNEKRLQTHIEGKLHSGYLKIREYLALLRRRKLDRKLKNDEEKEKEKSNYSFNQS